MITGMSRAFNLIFLHSSPILILSDVPHQQVQQVFHVSLVAANENWEIMLCHFQQHFTQPEHFSEYSNITPVINE